MDWPPHKPICNQDTGVSQLSGARSLPEMCHWQLMLQFEFFFNHAEEVSVQTFQANILQLH
eukprot:13678094-Ditylum_brightwellii.AAC.1